MNIFFNIKKQLVFVFIKEYFCSVKKFILFFLISGLSRLSFSQTGEFYNLYFEGNSLLVKGQFDKSIDKYNQALKVFDAAYVYYNRGNAYYGKKDYSNALKDYNFAIKINERYAEAYCQRGLIKLATGDKTACDDINKAAKFDLDDAKEAAKKK